jgi:glucoamylase
LPTGERGHYELAAGRDARPYLRTMQQSAVGIGLIPEQVWDQSAIPDRLLTPGGPTGAVIPLAWAHAEYIKLVRSIADQRVFDVIDPVRARYAGRTPRDLIPLEIWSRNRPIQSIPRGCRLRVVAGARFMLRWTSNEWQDQCEAVSIGTRLGVWFVDVPASSSSTLRLRLASSESSAEIDEATVEIV